jgi:hypothetical protein
MQYVVGDHLWAQDLETDSETKIPLPKVSPGILCVHTVSPVKIDRQIQPNFSPDGKVLVQASFNGVPHFCWIAKGELIHETQLESAQNPATTCDARMGG